jgi:hypothetical protein
MARKVYLDVVIKGEIIIELEEGVSINEALENLEFDIIDSMVESQGNFLGGTLDFDSWEITDSK